MSAEAIFDGPDLFDPNIFDTRQKNFNAVLVESISVSDVLTRKVQSFRTITENTVVADVLTRKVSSFRNIIENTAVADVVVAVFRN